ncbi:TBC1 domain family member 8B isoform X1 [Brachionus plicatilis]|uniref:TBC1 domain family member 8B isoform X1 n=1 Tax=Brachionus plicatilis TaxID=10195 RepID=A0A3M7S899_BRAPC|nr:TBC1 domain family member 8B isoform X1 [Brachionus plicatilis]
MWIKPEELLITTLWSSERGNMYFTLQRRRGQDEEKVGITGLLVATWDSVTESKLHKYRIIHHRENSEIYYSKFIPQKN